MSSKAPASEQSTRLTPQTIHWFRQQLMAWSEQNFRDFPWRHTTDPYKILIAELLLQKTDAPAVAPIYEAFLAKYPNLQVLGEVTVEEVASLLQPLGLFFRAERLCQTAQILLSEYNAQIPSSESELLKLPGVGKYTARSICANAFGQPAAVLDTNVARIIERFFGVRGERVKSRCKILWKVADDIVSQSDTSRWNLTLLDFGAAVCTARNPRCTDCPLQAQCHDLQK